MLALILMKEEKNIRGVRVVNERTLSMKNEYRVQK